eukprot:9403317-Pyramimonas_sp.AAC.1
MVCVSGNANKTGNGRPDLDPGLDPGLDSRFKWDITSMRCSRASMLACHVQLACRAENSGINLIFFLSSGMGWLSATLSSNPPATPPLPGNANPNEFRRQRGELRRQRGQFRRQRGSLVKKRRPKGLNTDYRSRIKVYIVWTEETPYGPNPELLT